MDKRGQITVFIILGIVIVAVIVLLFAFRKDIISTPATTENLNKIMRDINKHIEGCMEDSAEDPLNRIALQGGYLEVPADSYRLWDDTTVSYLCYNQPEVDRCMNRLLTRENMEVQLEKAIKNELMQCIDVQQFQSSGILKTYDVIAKNQIELDVVIARTDVLLELKFPITLKSTKDENVVSEDTFNVNIEKPLGDLYDVAMDIIDAETALGKFDTLTYMLSKTGRYTIYLQQPYPDKIYAMKLREGDYIFQFAVEGEPS